MPEKVVVEIDISLTGVKQDAVTVKNDRRYFFVCNHVINDKQYLYFRTWLAHIKKKEDPLSMPGIFITHVI